MWPTQNFTSIPQPQDILSPKNFYRYEKIIRDMGPSEIGDTLEGLQSFEWQLGFIFGWWTIRRLDLSEEETIFLVESGQSEVPEFADLTWDNAGRPFIAWENAEGVKIYWFNTETGQFQIDLIVPEGKNPFCHLDYRNSAQNALADIILTYERDNAVYYRIIGDRFTIEYPTPVTDLGKRRIFKAGVGTKLRYTICLA